MPPRPDFAAHRQAVLDRLEEDEAVLLFGAPHPVRNGDTEYRYRASSDLYWLSGWTAPECALFLRHGQAPFTLFCQPRDPERETWTGRRPGPEGAVAELGADAAFPIEQLDAELPRLLTGIRTLHHALGQDPEHDALLAACIRKAARAARTSFADVPETFHAPSRLLHELRLRKTPSELSILREAARITAEGHRIAMRAAGPGRSEQEIAAIVEHHFRMSGGSGAGYPSIVAGGDNANILHYIENDQPLRAGDLLLIDAGCELGLYTADVTRSFPVDGRFRPAQRDVYTWVLRAQQAALQAARPPGRFRDVHDAALRVLTEGMVELGLLEGDVEELIEASAYKRWFMHGTSHWLGLDVHDVGRYARDGQSRELEPDMVLTIEPGLYIPADAEDAPEALRGIGVRIEDDVRITEGAPEVLTAACPTAIDEVEALCQARA